MIYTEHLHWRLETRGISKRLPREIYENADRHFYDTRRRHHIAVSPVDYKGRVRLMMVAYDRTDDVVEIITIHPVKEVQIKHRLISGRWIKK